MPRPSRAIPQAHCALRVMGDPTVRLQSCPQRRRTHLRLLALNLSNLKGIRRALNLF